MRTRTHAARSRRLSLPLWMLALTVLAVFLSPKQSHARDGCNELLRQGYRDLRDQVSEAASDEWQVRQFCSDEYSKHGKITEVRATASVFGLFDAGTDVADQEVRERRKAFCKKNAASSKKYHYNSSSTREIHDRALDAWVQCLKLEKQGLKSEWVFGANHASVTISLAWPGSTKINFNGLEPSGRGQIRCTVAKPGGTKTELANRDTRFKLGTEVATFVCSRIWKRDKQGDEFTDALTLTLRTGEAPIIVHLPPVRLAMVEVAELQRRELELAELRAWKTAMDQRLDDQSKQITSLSTSVSTLDASALKNGEVVRLQNEKGKWKGKAACMDWRAQPGDAGMRYVQGFICNGHGNQKWKLSR